MSNALSTNNAASTAVITYGDPLSLFLLWQKALTMVPLWAIPLVAAFGLIARYMGTTALEFGFGGLVCFFIIYFLEGSLKCKIRLDDHNIFFGFRAFPIKDIVSVEVGNRKSKLLPGHLLITNSMGGQLKLSLDGLSADSIERIINHLKSHNSQLRVSPVVSALIKAKHAPQLPIVVPERMELSYQAGPLLSESLAVFKASAAKWIRVGPIVVSILVAPMWIGWLSTLFVAFQPHQYGATEQFGLTQFITKLSLGVGHTLYEAGSSGSQAICNASNNYWAIGAITLYVAAIFFYTQKSLWKPNRLIIDRKSLTSALRIGALTVPMAKVEWQQIKRLELVEGSKNNAKIHIEREGKKALNLDLSAINVDHRGLLLRRIQECVPSCPIQHQVAQSLLPQSDHSYTELWLQSLTQAPERKTLEPLEPGQLVGDNRYEMLNSVGVGGQGTAYLCRDTKVEGETRHVVLKETILPIFVDPLIRRKALESFEKEAKLLQNLVHPGVVQLVDYFVEDHRAYLVMEHVTGNNLRDTVQVEGPMSEERVQAIAGQLCTILQFLHEQGVVHRDFTPENLIMDSSSRIKLIDFNVAQQTQGGSQGTIVGKPSFMPPEQFRGKANTQSDIYAMGATLYFLLTGCDPDPISQSSPAAKNQSVGTAMDAIVKRATALQLKDRYQSVSEVVADLEKLAVEVTHHG